MVQILLNLLIGSILSTILGFIVKGWFEDMKLQVSSAVSKLGDVEKRFNEKIEKINQDQKNIYDNMLMKFSNWEDRIKKIIDDAGSNSFNRNDGDFRTHILQSFSDLDEVIRKDVMILKKEMNIVEHDLKELQGKEYDEDIVKQILNSVTRMNTQKNKDFIRVEDKIMKMYAMVKVLMGDQKKLEDKFKLFTEAMTTKIRLYEGHQKK